MKGKKEPICAKSVHYHILMRGVSLQTDRPPSFNHSRSLRWRYLRHVVIVESRCISCGTDTVEGLHEGSRILKEI